MTDFQAGTRVVIFDLDGVIADTEPLHQAAFFRLLDELGLDRSRAGDWHRFVGTADRPVLEHLIEGQTLPGNPSVESLLDRKAAHFLAQVREKRPLFPHVVELVETLSFAFVLAVASGSLRSAIAGVLELEGLRQHFRSVLSVQDVGRGKPAPDLFLRTAEILGAEPSECVVIEDSIPGVQAARTAGMRVMAVTNTCPAERLRQAGAHAIITDYRQIGEHFGCPLRGAA